MYYNTYQGALNLPPSKPQNLKVTSPNNWEAQLNWDPNKEPDIISGGMYKIYRCQTAGVPTTYDLIATINAYNNGQPVTSFIDDMIGPSVSSKLYYKISAVDNTQLESICSDYDWRMGRVPKITVDGIQGFEYALESNYPNPFNPSTIINYAVKDAGLVKLKVFDILGSEVAELVNELKEAGYHSVEFNASELPSGVYIYKIQAGSFINSKKMLLLK